MWVNSSTRNDEIYLSEFLYKEWCEWIPLQGVSDSSTWSDGVQVSATSTRSDGVYVSEFLYSEWWNLCKWIPLQGVMWVNSSAGSDEIYCGVNSSTILMDSMWVNSSTGSDGEHVRSVWLGYFLKQTNKTSKIENKQAGKQIVSIFYPSSSCCTA